MIESNSSKKPPSLVDCSENREISDPHKVGYLSSKWKISIDEEAKWPQIFKVDSSEGKLAYPLEKIQYIAIDISIYTQVRI